jgi:hypothetical protein
MTKTQFLTTVQGLKQEPKKPWIDYISEKIYSGKPGIYYLNRFIADIANKYPCGFYQYTTEPAFKKNEYKCGQTSKYAIERIHGQREAGEREVYVIVGWIPSDLAEIKNEDQRILLEMHNQKKCTLSKLLNPDMTTKEWAYFPNDNPEEVWREHLGSHAKKFDLFLTIWQLETLDTILSFLGEGKKKIMAELAARFGKTLLYLSMFLAVKHKILVIGTYYLSALSSFKKEISRYSEFSDLIVLELSSVTFQEDFNQGLNDDKKIVVLSSLCGDKTADETVRNQNAQFIENFTDKITVIDEADYGAHTESCVPFVNRIGHGAPVILTTGTNSERARGFHSDVDAFFRVTYLDMLMKAVTKLRIKNAIVNQFKRADKFEKNLARVQFYRYDWSRFLSYIDGYEVELNPSFSKCSADVRKNSGFWIGLYQSFMGVNPVIDANDYSLFNCLENDTAKSVIQFTSMDNKQLDALESIAKPILDSHYDVYVIHGEKIKGKEAEQFVKDKIRIAESKGKHVWIIACNMCQRSFSIPEINVVILTYDNGDTGATVQKMSRALTAGDSSKIGHIISISIDGNRDDKVTTMIIDTAKEVADHEGIDVVTALRKVMKSLPIFQMGEDGYNIRLEPDEYSKEIFSSSNSHQLIANNANFFLDDNGYEVLLKCSNVIKKLDKNKVDSAFEPGKTYLEKKESNSSQRTKDEIAELRKTLRNIVDRIDYCVRQISKVERKIDYAKFVSILEQKKYVSEIIGIDSSELQILVNDNYICKDLFSIYLECVVSK